MLILEFGKCSIEVDESLKAILNDKVMELRELCLSKFYFIYEICISSCLAFLLVRNVITHSQCVVCV